jgi:hypothetical protein
MSSTGTTTAGRCVPGSPVLAAPSATTTVRRAAGLPTEMALTWGPRRDQSTGGALKEAADGTEYRSVMLRAGLVLAGMRCGSTPLGAKGPWPPTTSCNTAILPPGAQGTCRRRTSQGVSEGRSNGRPWKFPRQIRPDHP